MDRITFESVMEEIKKSLGEARLMKIGEESVADTQAEIQKGIDARDATRRQKVDDADAATTPPRGTSTPAPAPAATPAPAPAAAAPAPSPTPAPAAIQATTALMAPGATTGGAFKPEAPKPELAPIRNIGAAAQVGNGSSTYSTSPLNNTPAKPTTSSAPSTGAGTVAKPAAPKSSAPKPLAPAGVDTASIYKKHGVGGSDEDAGAFHRAEAEIAAARKATPSAPTARPSAPSATRPATPSAPRPVSQGGAVPTPPPRPMSSLSASGQAMAKQYSGKVGTDDSGNNPMPAPQPKAVSSTPAVRVNRGDKLTQGATPSDAGSMRRNTTPRVSATPMRENFDQFVKKFLKESK